MKRNDKVYLDLSNRKVAKIGLPTAVKQPKSHMLNRALRDIERFVQQNPGICGLWWEQACILCNACMHAPYLSIPVASCFNTQWSLLNTGALLL